MTEFPIGLNALTTKTLRALRNTKGNFLVKLCVLSVLVVKKVPLTSSPLQNTYQYPLYFLREFCLCICN